MGIPATAVCGFRSKAESFCIEEVRILSDSAVFTSDCGDLDVCGNAVDALESISLEDSVIYTCGPVPMMREAARIAARKGIRCQASLEERMGCGTGICLVCACRINTSSGDYEYKRCCKDGPVFDAKEVAWESM
jgi:dihydroorotate dehydrogenase electron transfer subunit